MRPLPETVIGIGDLTVDTLLPLVDRMPDWGQETLIEEPRRRLGGNIGNMAVGAAALKADFVSIGWIGDDEEAVFIKEKLRDLHLSTVGLKTFRGGKTSRTFACIRSDGERLFFTYPGVLNHMESLFHGLELPPGKVVFLSGWCLPPRVSPEVLIEKIKAWQEEDRWVAIDLIWSDACWEVKPEIINVLSHCDTVFLNEDEFSALSGKQDAVDRVMSVQEFQSWCAGWSEKALFVMKRGKKGAYAVRGSEVYAAEALAVEIDHTVGAGDLFNISFIHAFWNLGETILRALEFACAFTGLSIRKNVFSYPSENDVYRILEKRR